MCVRKVHLAIVILGIPLLWVLSDCGRFLYSTINAGVKIKTTEAAYATGKRRCWVRYAHKRIIVSR